MLIGHAVRDPLTRQILATYDDSEAKNLEIVYRERVASVLDHWCHTADTILGSQTSSHMPLQHQLDSTPRWCQNM